MSTQQNLFLHKTALQVKEFAKIKSETDLRLKVRDAALRLALKKLAKKIQPKVYEYEFLRK